MRQMATSTHKTSFLVISLVPFVNPGGTLPTGGCLFANNRIDRVDRHLDQFPHGCQNPIDRVDPHNRQSPRDRRRGVQSGTGDTECKPRRQKEFRMVARAGPTPSSVHLNRLSWPASRIADDGRVRRRDLAEKRDGGMAIQARGRTE